MTSDARPVWPRRFPVYRFSGLILALACGALLVRAWIQFAPPLQRFYLRTYAAQTVLGSLPKLRTKALPKPFPMAFAGKQLATDDLLATNHGPLSMKLVSLDPSAFHAWLKVRIYRGKVLGELFRWPLIGFSFCVLLFGAFGAVLDRSRNAEARNGRLLRGPSLMSRWHFNRQTKGDGLAFPIDNPPNLLERLSGNSALRIRRDREAHHIQIAGDTGSGKSTLVRDILYQVEARGETAIVFDPDREYIREFLNEERGDWVLNPLDERCPYWEIESEAATEAAATSIALSLWPDEPNQQPFFKKHPRAIFAYLISRYNRYNCTEDPATCESLARWLSNPRAEITPRLRGTRHAVSTDANAKDQSQGLWATLGEVATPLGMMPPFEGESRREWTVRQWTKERRGWIFITSTPDTLDALRPLQSLWLDMLILALQSSDTEPGQSRVWMILDELAALNALPQLQSALTRQRKSDNPIVLGFQGMSQLDALYGKKAETILSQAYTNIVLRTREPRAAEHLSKLIGSAQLERVNESRPAHWFGSHQRHSYSTQRFIDPVVMSAEIQGLPDLSGYFVQQDKVVPIRFHPRTKRIRAEGLIERIVPAQLGTGAATSVPIVACSPAGQDPLSPAISISTPDSVFSE